MCLIVWKKYFFALAIYTVPGSPTPIIELTLLFKCAVVLPAREQNLPFLSRGNRKSTLRDKGPGDAQLHPPEY